jgi:hypothetical protein
MGSLLKKLRRRKGERLVPDMRIVKWGAPGEVYVEFNRNGPPPGRYRPADLNLTFEGAKPPIEFITVLATPRAERRRLHG